MKQYRFVIFTLVFLLVGTLLLGAAGCKKPDVTPPIEEVPVDTCLSAGEQIDKDICYKTRSADEDITDYTFCNVINDWVLRDDCYENVFTRIARSVDCEGIEERDIRDSCLMVDGISTGPYICDKIINLDKRDKCYFEITKSLSYPADIEQTICTNINNEALEEECLIMIQKPFGERS